MNVKTRSLVISQLEAAIRERVLPFLPQRLLDESKHFVHRDVNPSPAAADGTNDDCVFAAAITLELYRLRGAHPMLTARREKMRKRKPDYETMYPFLPADEEKRQKELDQRYAPEGSTA